MFIANYIDRVNIGFVNSYMQRDLGMGAEAFGLGSGVFFVGYAIFEVPSNLLMAKFGARAWLTRFMFTWGLVAAAMAFVWNDMSFYVLRFLLGVAEAGFFPGVVYYFTQWLPQKERGKTVAIFLGASALASVMSGPISGGLLSIRGFGLHGWQWMFLIEGLFSIVLCFASWFLVKSHIRDASWLTGDERDALETTIAEEQAEREAAGGAHVPIMKLLKDPQIILFCLLYFAIQLTIYAATFWLPTIIRKMGDLTDFQVGLFNAIPWLIAMVAMYFFAVWSAKWGFQQTWLAASLVIAAPVPSTPGNPVFSFVAICFSAIGFKTAASLFWPIPQGCLDARVAAAVLALINAIGNLGGFLAPATFGCLQQHTGSITGGLSGLGVASLIAAAATFLAKDRASRALPAAAIGQTKAL
jgi:MFS family permease